MTFEGLKWRYHSLSLRVVGLPDRSCDITGACCVLHNTATIWKEKAAAAEMQPDNLEPVQLDQPSARAARSRIVAQYFGQVNINFLLHFLHALHTWSGALLCWHFVPRKKSKHWTPFLNKYCIFTTYFQIYIHFTRVDPANGIKKVVFPPSLANYSSDGLSIHLWLLDHHLIFFSALLLMVILQNSRGSLIHTIL